MRLRRSEKPLKRTSLHDQRLTAELDVAVEQELNFVVRIAPHLESDNSLGDSYIPCNHALVRW